MSITIPRLGSKIPIRNEIIDFEERPACSTCNNPMTICSHSTPSKVIGFEGFNQNDSRNLQYSDL
jgi:hypothetical protein